MGCRWPTGLIRAGAARRVLLITAETYSKYIDPTDRSLRTIFGDGAAATLVEAAEEPSLGAFVFGTDGRGADTLLVTEGGARPKQSAIQPRKRRRWPSSLYMDGPELVKFSLEVVPPLVDRVLAQANWTRDKVDMYLLHQATLFMLDHLRERLSHRPRTYARGARGVRQHGFLDDSDSDPRSSPLGPPAAGQANPLDRLRRGSFLGRLHVDRNLVGQAGSSGRKGRQAAACPGCRRGFGGVEGQARWPGRRRLRQRQVSRSGVTTSAL